MKRRTVLHLIESDGPGGAETVFADLVRRIEDENFHSIAVLPGRTPWLTDALSGHTVLKAASTGWPQKRPFDLAYASTLRRIFNDTRADVVHAHSFGCAVYASFALLGSRAKLISTFHGLVDISASGRLTALKWRMLSRAAAIVCVSESLRMAACATPGVRASRVQTIYNGIDVAQFEPARHDRLRDQLGLAPGTVLLGAAGNVRPAKAYDVLLHAMAALRDRGMNVHLAIAGDVTPSPLVESLRTLTRDLGLAAHVTYLGFVAEIAEFLNGLDVFVLSSHTEGFSIATVQALAVGLPVVATRCGGPEEILQDGLSGLLVDVGSSFALADGVGRVIADVALRTSLSQAATRRSLEAFSLDMMVQKYEELYHLTLGTLPGD